MVKKQDNYSIQQSSMRYLKRNLERLSASYEKQFSEIEDFARWNLANDIVSDWENYEQVVDCLFKAKLIDESIVAKFQKLVNNFDEVSCNGLKYEETIWTLEGLKNHPFWGDQRLLAKELLRLLEQI